MKLLDKVKKSRYRKEFEHRYMLLNDEEKEVLQLLLVCPRTGYQLRSKGYTNANSIIKRLISKGWDISSYTNDLINDKVYTFEGENPWL